MTPMIVEHPLLQHKISLLRNKQTGTKEFRDLVGEIATLLCYEATRDLPLEEVEIEDSYHHGKDQGAGRPQAGSGAHPARRHGYAGRYADPAARR